MSRPVVAPLAIRRATIAHARRDAPRECCGFLLGQGSRIRFAVPMTNIEAGTTRYRIDDKSHVTLRRMLRDAAPPLAIVGVYHSHPAGAANPSPSDVRESMYPEWIYMIVGLRSERAAVRAFQIQNGVVRDRKSTRLNSSHV